MNPKSSFNIIRYPVYVWEISPYPQWIRFNLDLRDEKDESKILCHEYYLTRDDENYYLIAYKNLYSRKFTEYLTISDTVYDLHVNERLNIAPINIEETLEDLYKTLMILKL